MKKFILLSIASLILSVSTKADDKEIKAASKSESISDNVLREFSYNFFKASNVNWTINNKFQKATFKINGKDASAIYNTQNQFLVATQEEGFDSLPLDAQKSIKQKYVSIKGLTVVKVISRSENYQYNDDTDSFWISFLNNDQQVILLVSPDANISIVSSKKIN